MIKSHKVVIEVSMKGKDFYMIMMSIAAKQK